MKPRLCLLNISYSGSNPHLIRELSRWVDLEVVEVPFPGRVNALLKLKSFHPRIARWKSRHARSLDWAFKSHKVFESRSALAFEGVSRLAKKPDAILQIGGLFSPGPTGIPYATYNDFTTALAAREYPHWAPFPTPMAAKRWYDLETRLYIDAARVLTLSDHTRRSMISDYGVPEGNVKTVGAGGNFTSVPERTTPYDGRTVLFVGLDFERKGGRVLLDAFDNVRSSRPDARLLIAGPELAAAPPGVTCFGEVRDRGALLDLYRRASIFAMPSLCEPFGFVFLEAMACKLPCIGTTADAMPEIIEDGRTGRVVPPGDPDALAAAILDLLSDPKRLAEMGEASRRRVSKHFTWEHTAARIVAEIRAMI
ncbi:MAG: glycosyltransferase family 4 protein [Armatimonadetes bacterium]|nr:glycosyltransferase family 4 protein [Armatimonadota bacterium]